MFPIIVLRIYDYSGIKNCGLVESPVPRYNMEEKVCLKALKRQSHVWRITRSSI